jgi:hypothetical protein
MSQWPPLHVPDTYPTACFHAYRGVRLKSATDGNDITSASHQANISTLTSFALRWLLSKESLLKKTFGWLALTVSDV